MPAVLVRNLSVETHRALKQRAAKSGKSTQAEIVQILDDAVLEKAEVGLGTRMRQIAKEHGGWDLDIQRDKTPARHPTFE